MTLPRGGGYCNGTLSLESLAFATGSSPSTIGPPYSNPSVLSDRMSEFLCAFGDCAQNSCVCQEYYTGSMCESHYGDTLWSSYVVMYIFTIVAFTLSIMQGVFIFYKISFFHNKTQNQARCLPKAMSSQKHTNRQGSSRKLTNQLHYSQRECDSYSQSQASVVEERTTRPGKYTRSVVQAHDSQLESCPSKANQSVVVQRVKKNKRTVIVKAPFFARLQKSLSKIPVVITLSVCCGSIIRLLHVYLLFFRVTYEGSSSATDETLSLLPSIPWGISMFLSVYQWQKLQNRDARTLAQSKKKVIRMAVFYVFVSFISTIIQSIAKESWARNLAQAVAFFVISFFMLVYITNSLFIIYKLVKRLKNFDFDQEAQAFSQRMTNFSIVGLINLTLFGVVLIAYSVINGRNHGPGHYLFWLWSFRLLECWGNYTLYYLSYPGMFQSWKASAKQLKKFICLFWAQNAKIFSTIQSDRER